MNRLPFRLYLIVAFVAAAMLVWLPVYLGGVHGYQQPALLLSLAWCGLFALGFVLYGRRGLWLLLAAPPALSWLIVVGVVQRCFPTC